MSDIRHLTSDLWHHISVMRCLTSNVCHQTSVITRLTSDICHQTSGMRHLSSDIWHQTSDIIPLPTDVWHQTSVIRHLSSSDGLLVWARWPILPVWGHLLYPARKDYDLAKSILNSLLFGQDGWMFCGSRTVFWLLFEWVSCRKIRLAFVFDTT